PPPHARVPAVHGGGGEGRPPSCGARGHVLRVAALRDGLGLRGAWGPREQGHRSVRADELVVRRKRGVQRARPVVIPPGLFVERRVGDLVDAWLERGQRILGRWFRRGRWRRRRWQLVTRILTFSSRAVGSAG